MAEDARPFCTSSIYEPAGPASPSAAFADDQSYFISARRLQNGRASFTVAGDTVRLSAETMPSLARPAETEATKVARLTVDARRIVVDMTIALDEADVSLQAETIEFTSRGAIVLSQPPTTSNQVISVVADRVDFRRARPTPFVFFTADWVNESWPKPSGPRRSVVITAREVIPRDDDDELSRDNLAIRPARYFHNLSLDRGRSSRLGDMWRDNWKVNIGAEGKSAWSTALRETMIWPDYTAAKILKHYGRAPYYEPTRKFLWSLLDMYEPLFVSRVSQTAATVMAKTRGLVSSGYDPFGLPRHYVPMRTLGVEIQDFNERVNAAFAAGSGLVELWDETYVFAATGARLDLDKIASVRKAVDADQAELQLIQSDLDVNLTQQSALRQQITNTLTRVNTRQNVLRDKWADAQKAAGDARNLAQIRSLVPVAAVVVSAVFPAAAPAAMAVSQAVSVAGDLAIASRTSGSPLSLSGAVKTIADVQIEHKEWQKRAEDLGGAWRNAKEAAGPAWDFLRGNGKREDVGKFIDTNRE